MAICAGLLTGGGFYAQSADSVYAELSHEALVDSILNFGRQFQGVPYRYGGRSPSGFDCSGLVSYIFSHYNIHLPRSSRSYVHVGEEVKYEDLQPGDILLFKGRNASSSLPGHVSVVVKVTETEIYMLHASTTRGVLIEDYKKHSYYTRRYIGARRVVPRG